MRETYRCRGGREGGREEERETYRCRGGREGGRHIDVEEGGREGDI